MLKSKRNKLFVLIAAAAALMLLASCGSETIHVPDTYNYDDLTKYITLGKYEGIEYELDVEKVTDDDVQARIDQAISDATTTEDVTSGTVKKDDTVKIDFTGKIDGKTFDGGTAENYTLDIANDSMIDGFSEGIVGHKVGDTFDLDLKFPDDYSNEDVAGKDVTFTITVNAIVETVVPKYNDEFVQENTEYDTTKEYEAAIRKELEEDNEEEAESNARSSVFLEILDDSEVVEYPEKELTAAEDSMKETYENLADTYGMEYSALLNTYFGMTEDEFDEQIETYAQNTVKQQLVLRQLAKVLDISISDDDYNEYLQQLMSDNGLSDSTFEDTVGMSLADYAEQNNLYDAMLYEKVMDQVMELSVEK